MRTTTTTIGQRDLRAEALEVLRRPEEEPETAINVGRNKTADEAVVIVEKECEIAVDEKEIVKATEILIAIKAGIEVAAEKENENENENEKDNEAEVENEIAVNAVVTHFPLRKIVNCL